MITPTWGPAGPFSEHLRSDLASPTTHLQQNLDGKPPIGRGPAGSLSEFLRQDLTAPTAHIRKDYP